MPEITAIQKNNSWLHSHREHNDTRLSPFLQMTHGPNLSSSTLHLSTTNTEKKNSLIQLKLEKKFLNDESASFKESILSAAKRANYPYTRNDKNLPEGWACQKHIAKRIADETRLQFVGNKGMIKSASGLVAYVLSSGKEICLVFGGTTSGEHTGGLVKRNLTNPKTTFSQWISNGKSAVLGGIPESYDEAVAITTKLKNILTDSEYKNFSLSIVGHSLGGGESSYAAAMVGTPEKPITSINFCSAELSEKMKLRILEQHGNNSLRDVTAGIIHIKIKGDPVPNMHKIFNKISNIGISYTIEPSTSDSRIELHDKFLKHVTNYVTENR